jgi:hypothetical protein
MKSAGVHPVHFACMIGQYACSSLAGLSTTIIPATISPRYTSKHISLDDNFFGSSTRFPIPARVPS